MVGVGVPLGEGSRPAPSLHASVAKSPSRSMACTAAGAVADAVIPMIASSGASVLDAVPDLDLDPGRGPVSLGSTVPLSLLSSDWPPAALAVHTRCQTCRLVAPRRARA